MYNKGIIEAENGTHINFHKFWSSFASSWVPIRRRQLIGKKDQLAFLMPSVIVQVGNI